MYLGKHDPERWVGPSSYHDLGATLILISLIGALITVGGLAHTKLESDRGIAALQAMCDDQAALVSRMEDEGEPGYRVRFARARLDMMDRMLRRARAGERVALDELGRQATKDALVSLLKGQFLNDIASLGDLAFDTTLKLSDAYHGTTSPHQRRLLEVVRDLNDRLQGAGGEGTDLLQGDALDVFIAAAELNHLARVVREERGIDETDPVFANVLKRYVSDYYLREGERPLPAQIRAWVDTMLEAKSFDEPPPPEKEPPEGDGGEYIVWVNLWPDYKILGLDWSQAGDWVQAHGSEIGTVQIGTVSEGRRSTTYADDPVLNALIAAQCRLHPPEAITCDQVRATGVSRWPVTVEEGGRLTLPRFDTREEASAWVCARLQSARRRDTITLGGRSEKVTPFVSARMDLGSGTEPVILGNVACP